MCFPENATVNFQDVTDWHINKTIVSLNTKYYISMYSQLNLLKLGEVVGSHEVLFFFLSLPTITCTLTKYNKFLNSHLFLILCT